jgi:hypothetical protein
MHRPDELYEQIVALLPKNPSHFAYGSDVMPVLNLYKKLDSDEDRQAFGDALEKMLLSRDKKVRRFAVSICMGFFVFRNVV